MFGGMSVRGLRLASSGESVSPEPQVCLPESYAAMRRTLDRSALEIEAKPRSPVAMPTAQDPTHRFSFEAHPPTATQLGPEREGSFEIVPAETVSVQSWRFTSGLGS